MSPERPIDLIFYEQDLPELPPTLIRQDATEN